MKKENTMRFLLPALLGPIFGILVSSSASAIGEGWFGAAGTADSAAYQPQVMAKRGAVYTRQVIPGPNGGVQYVGYDVDGSEAAYYGEVPGAKVASAVYYNALLSQLAQLKTQFPQLEVLDRATYSSRPFTTVDGKTITPPTLADDTVLIAVRPASQLFTVDTNPALMESPIDLRFGPLDSSIKSLLINADGTVKADAISPYNIGPRVAYYGDLGAAQGNGTYNPGSSNRSNNDTIFGPLPGLLVEVGAGLGYAITDAEGKYHIIYTVPACPGFTMEYNNWVVINMNYHRFNPKGLPDRPRPLFWKSTDFCNGLGALGYAAGLITLGSSVIIEPQRDFPIDLTVLNGRARMNTDVKVTTGDTTYDNSRADLTRVIQDRYNNHDFDRDGTPDKVEMGRIVDATDTAGNPVTQFEIQPTSANPQIMGIWLSSRHSLTALQAPGQGNTNLLIGPDLTRLTDWSADFEDRALLRQLSADDLLNTDLYIFRESDGSLLMERRGLTEQEMSGARVGVTSGDSAFQYTLRFLSRPNSNMNAGMSGATNADEFTKFQVREGVLNEALHQRDADQLRPGEQLRIVAINRPTGYIGSTTATLTGATTLGTSVNVDIQSDDIILGPPNLKVWAERVTDSVQDQTIGNEGAGLGSDRMIKIFTEWFDADNRPLPAALGEYGYSGRFAMLTETNALKAVGGNYLANFSIKPGRQHQVISLSGAAAVSQHLYVHVSGTPSSRKPDFSNSEQGTGILQFRPDRFVPVKVPLYDEATTDLQLDAWRTARDAGLPNLSEPEPVYQWVSRPELQFTMYDLHMQEVWREDATGQREDLLAIDFPELTGDEVLIDLFYSIFAPVTGNNELLQVLQTYSYNGPQELVLAIGDQELIILIDPNNPDGQITFVNLDEIMAALNPDDLLTLQLYANNDAANILWELATLTLDVAVDLNRDGVMQYADTDYLTPAGLPSTNNADKPSDKTTPTRPYRFWINNDLDVVNSMGEIQWNNTHCTAEMNPVYDAASTAQYEQVCEQWDDDTLNGQQTNTSTGHLTRIESYRDLEDFAPLEINLGKSDLGPNYSLVLKTNNININLFRGVWDDSGNHKAHEYIYDSYITALQMEKANNGAGHVATLASGQSKTLQSYLIKELTDRDGVIRLIFEGTAPNAGVCASQPEQCYLSVAVYKEGKTGPLVERKVYLDLQNVEKFYQTYTAGTAEQSGYNPGDPGTFECSLTAAPGYPPQDPVDIHPADISGDKWIYDGIQADASVRNNKAILVHGWRMRDSEKKSFADAAYKRLYWLGYQGDFAAVTWPTGWFYKPSHCYGLGPAWLAGQNAQNYDQSDVVARLTGQKLEKWLAMQNAPNTHLHLIVHSMGNVVVSEALRHHAAGQLVDSYSASQAAEVGGSYDAALGDMQNAFDNEGVSAEAFWRQNNQSSAFAPDYAMPPDIYRYNNLISQTNGVHIMQHQQTTTAQLQVLSEQLKTTPSDKTHYYSGIADKVGRIISFFNTGDAALTAWEFDQLTKPNSGLGGAVWDYSNEQACAAQISGVSGAIIGWEYPDGAACPGPSVAGVDVISRFYKEKQALSWDTTIPQPGQPYTQEQRNYLEIMGHVIPARTEALGQVDNPGLAELSGIAKFNEFTTSNQGHSAQFHGYLSEPNRGRESYWLRVMEDGIKLDPYVEGNYSGLYPTTNVTGTQP